MVEYIKKVTSEISENFKGSDKFMKESRRTKGFKYTYWLSYSIYATFKPRKV